MPLLKDYNSLRVSVDWIASPDIVALTNRQFREATRLMVSLYRSGPRPLPPRNRQRRHLDRLIAIWGCACVYCGTADGKLEIEQIIPRARGGSDDFENLTLACRPCNQAKRTMTAEEFGFPHLRGLAVARA